MPKCLLVWMTYTTQWIIYECQAKCLSREHKELYKQMSSKCRLHMLYIVYTYVMYAGIVCSTAGMYAHIRHKMEWYALFNFQEAYKNSRIPSILQR